MRHRLGSWFVSLAALLVFLTPGSAQSQHLSYLPLQQPGQASIAIDLGAHTAYIIDFGKDASGSDIRFDGKPLLDRLDELEVRHLVVSCSHPHADHMGGIQALFKDPARFVKDGKSRFESITFIDDGVSNRLRDIYETVRVEPAVKAQYFSAKEKNAFAEVSKPTDAVFVENIPYAHDTATGAHGAAVVTKIKLNGEYTVLDFDDASTPVIKRVVTALQNRTTDPIVAIDAFVVPHHGSRYHDVEPILALSPKKAIITVNPRNRYGHPAPEILTKLIENLGAENVIFTGSTGGVVLDGKGIKSAQYTAADPASFELFVAPNRLRAKRLGRSKEEIALYATIEAQMRGPHGPDAPSAPARVPLDPTPSPSGGGATARRASAADLVSSEIIHKGTMHSTKFDVGHIRNGGRDATELAQSSRLPGIPEPLHRARVAVVRDPATAAILPEDAPATLAKLTAYDLPNREPRADQTLTVDYQAIEGLADGLVASRTMEPTDASRVVAAMQKRDLPNGGMVFLDGGRLFPVGPAGQLHGGKLDICGTQYCIASAGDGKRYLLPFSPSLLFAEVWDKVVRKRIPSFYLSINPTKKFLEAATERLLSVPSDKLRFGTGTPPSDANFNEVVTRGDIANSPIGDILWKADVRFKSASLGLNVLTGARSGSPVSLVGLDPWNFAELLTEEDQDDRWCRLYWTSGAQHIVVDTAAGKVRLDGDAVVARAEPMLRKGVRLVEWPEGSWCGASKTVAKRLQRAANNGTGTPELLQLRELAQIQSFAKWTLESNLTTSPAFAKSIDEQQQRVGHATVPTWTSGIRGNNAAYVEALKHWSASPWNLGLRISAPHGLQAATCLIAHYNPNEDFTAHKLRKEHGKWQYNKTDIPYFSGWIDTVAKKIATCLGGAVVSSAGDAADVDEPIVSDGGINAPTIHIQPIDVHGGVLLGSDKEARKARWLKEGRIALPDGRLIMKRDGTELHFWSFDDAHPTFASIGQHVVFSSGKVIEIEGVEGRLRILVETTAGATIRQEARIGRVPNRFGGAEWMEVRDGDGALIADKAAWFCDDAHHDEVCVSDMDLSAFGHLIKGDEAKPAILTEQIASNVWLIDLDIEDIRKELDAQLNAATEATGRFVVMGEYADWGFQVAADDLLKALQESSESEDFILTREYNPTQLHALGAVVAVLELEEAVKLKGQPAAFLNVLLKVEKLTADLPATYSADIWELLALLCDGSAADFASGPHATKFANMRERYVTQRVRTTALRDGAMNPWGEEEPDEETKQQ
jgi:beta-lactamase superfamily II metal-dependent hydrolase